MIVAADPAFRTRHANPYNALLYGAIAERGVDVREFSRRELLTNRPDIVHLHWPELSFLSSHRAVQNRARIAMFSALIRLARRRGTRLVLTLHNDDAHGDHGSPTRARLDRMLAGTVDGAFALSAAGITAAREQFGSGLPIFLTPHGHYRDAYPFELNRAQARDRLGLEPQATQLVAVGQIRRYKNLSALVAATRATPDAALRLAIAGAVGGSAAANAAIESELLGAAGGDPRIRFEFARLDELGVANWLCAADLVVLPYRRILNSGAAILALSAARPVVVPALGAMPELAATVGPEWVRLYDGEFSPQVLADAVAWLRRTPRGDSPNLDALDWGPIAEATISGYRAVLATRRRH